MKKLGGSLFIRNAIKLDYCVEESIRSIADVCNEVVVLDAQSDDGTLELIKKVSSGFKHVRVVENANWNCAEDYHRLAILANQAIDLLDTEWHFMIQADEVLHESSHKGIWEAIDSNQAHSYHVRRFNLFGDMDHYIKFNIPNQQKPCSDAVNRLARKGCYAVGDAESLMAPSVSTDFTNAIHLFHYGYVRRDDVNITKPIEMQSWFYGPNSEPDPRLVEMQKTGVYRSEAFIPWENLAPIFLTHPKYSSEWANRRRK